MTSPVASGGVVPYRNLPHDPNDPLSGLWPATLPLELAMGDDNPAEICRAYGIDKERFMALGRNPAFRAEVKAAIEALRKEGASFRVRAQMQAVELLKRSYHMIHDKAVPHAVQADLLKFTVRAAGLDASVAKANTSGNGMAQSFTINLNLGG